METVLSIEWDGEASQEILVHRPTQHVHVAAPTNHLEVVAEEGGQEIIFDIVQLVEVLNLRVSSYQVIPYAPNRGDGIGVDVRC